jgi:hypothetical protein
VASSLEAVPAELPVRKLALYTPPGVLWWWFDDAWIVAVGGLLFPLLEVWQLAIPVLKAGREPTAAERATEAEGITDLDVVWWSMLGTVPLEINGGACSCTKAPPGVV